MDGFYHQPNITPNYSCICKGKERSEVDGLTVCLMYGVRARGCQRGTDA